MSVSKVTKRSLLSGVIIILMMLAYTFAFCIYTFEYLKDATFNGAKLFDVNLPMMWISYGFTMGIFVLAFVTSILAFERKELRSRVFGIPIVFVGFTSITIQLIVDVIVMVVGGKIVFNEYSWIFLVIAETTFVILSIILVLIRQAYRSLVVENIEAHEAKNTEYIKELRIQLQMVCEMNDIDELDKPLFRLYEEAKYADPVSVKEVQAVEDEILEAVETLKDSLAKGDVEVIRSDIEKVQRLLNERKIRCKSAKN